jgi:hypothetical protein
MATSLRYLILQRGEMMHEHSRGRQSTFGKQVCRPHFNSEQAGADASLEITKL